MKPLYSDVLSRVCKSCGLSWLDGRECTHNAYPEDGKKVVYPDTVDEYWDALMNTDPDDEVWN